VIWSPRSLSAGKSLDVLCIKVATLTVGGSTRSTGAGASGGASWRWQFGPLQGLCGGL